MVDEHLLETKLKYRLNAYTVVVNNVQKTKGSRWSWFPLYRGVYRYGLGKIVLRTLAIPPDILWSPVILAHNGVYKLRKTLSGIWYESNITLTIPREVVSAIEDFRPGSPGYLEAKENFENLAVRII